mgnify:CR=1 FL=1
MGNCHDRRSRVIDEKAFLGGRNHGGTRTEN